MEKKKKGTIPHSKWSKLSGVFLSSLFSLCSSSFLLSLYGVVGPFDTHEEDGYSVEETGWSVPMYASLNESVSALLSPAQQRDMQVVQQALEEDSTCLDSPPPTVEVPGEKEGEER